MNHPQPSWQRLAAAARTPRDGRDEAAPYGFATRVSAQALAAKVAGSPGLLEKFALRGLIAACTLSLAAMSFAGLNASADDAELMAGDIVLDLLDLS